MKGKLSDLNDICLVEFDFELSETPEEILLRLLQSEPQEVMQSLFRSAESYKEAKANGSFDKFDSSIGVIWGYDAIFLDWEKTLQAQIGDKLKTLAPEERILFVIAIAKIA